MQLTERQTRVGRTTKAVNMGSLEAWVAAVHGKDAYKGDMLKQRLIHAMRVLIVHVRLIGRPTRAHVEARELRIKGKKHARWSLEDMCISCAHIQSADTT